MGNSIIQQCTNNHQKITGFEQSSSEGNIQSKIKIPQRLKIVDAIYSKLTSEKPLNDTIENQKNQLLQLKHVDILGVTAIYIGRLSQNILNAPAQIFFRDGNFIDAIFAQGNLNCSDGIFIQQNGAYYRGGFKNSKRFGKGVLYVNGQYYYGNFENGFLEGEGQILYSNGDVYKGKLKNNLRQGRGTMYWKNGITYKGQFSQDQPNGVGHYQTPQYSYYGPFKDGLKEGKGTIFFKDGRKFEGWLEKDKFCGYGELHYLDKRVEKGDFTNFKF